MTPPAFTSALRAASVHVVIVAAVVNREGAPVVDAVEGLFGK